MQTLLILVAIAAFLLVLAIVAQGALEKTRERLANIEFAEYELLSDITAVIRFWRTYDELIGGARWPVLSS